MALNNDEVIDSNCCQNLGKPLNVSIEEKEKKYEYKNNAGRTLIRCKVDDCVNINNGKCDYLLIDDTCRIAYFIELKGSDLNKAIDQIENTINHIANKLKNYEIRIRIILSRTNTTALESSKVKKFKMYINKLNKQNNKNISKNVFICKSRQYTENV